MDRAVLITTLVVALAGCAPADVAGNYDITVTNGANPCDMDGWREGTSSENVEVLITQSDDVATARIQGLVGGAVQLWLGSREFSGTVSGSDLNLTLVGTTRGMVPGCPFTVNAELDASVDGQFLEGEIRYVPQTDGSTACGALNTCENVQTLVGTRPPPAE